MPKKTVPGNGQAVAWLGQWGRYVPVRPPEAASSGAQPRVNGMPTKVVHANGGPVFSSRGRDSGRGKTQGKKGGSSANRRKARVAKRAELREEARQAAEAD